MDILDYAFYYFVENMKKYAIYIPHSAKVDAQCKILGLKMSAYVKVKVDKGKDGRGIFPTVEDVKSSFSVLTSSLADTRLFCAVEAGLYDEMGNVIYEMRKFRILQHCTFIIFQTQCDFLLALKTPDLTTYIPNKLHSLFFSNAVRLSVSKKQVTYKVELNAKEKDQVNSILSQVGSKLSELIKTPTHILNSVKFSDVISNKLSIVYRTIFPQVIRSALSRAQTETVFLWNFLVALRTGKMVK